MPVLNGPYYSHGDIAVKPRKLVVMLHGYGVSGGVFLRYAGHMLKDHPEVLFFAPDAPYPFEHGEEKQQTAYYQWCSTRQDLSAAEKRAQFEHSRECLVETLDHLFETYGLTAQDCLCMGFSQGAMMALHVGLQQPKPLAGVIAASGRLLFPEEHQAESATKSPVLLCHGAEDTIITPDAVPLGKERLSELGIQAETFVAENTAHTINKAMLGVMDDFARRALSF